jgi:hypothetical protein
MMEALQGGFEIGFAMLTPFLRAQRRKWGATDKEIETSHPGDELVPRPKWTANHAISINATPAEVWPWVAQLGQGRGGFYSYEKLENLAGCKIENAGRILEEYQQVQEGDPIRLHPEMPPMTVSIVDEPRAFVLHGNPGEAEGSSTLSTSWAFLILEQPDGTTRLLSRTRYHHGDNFRSKLMGGPVLIEPISFVMERKMLEVIKKLVESRPT